MSSTQPNLRSQLVSELMIKFDISWNHDSQPKRLSRKIQLEGIERQPFFRATLPSLSVSAQTKICPTLGMYLPKYFTCTTIQN